MKERIKMKVGLLIAALAMSVGAFGGSVYVKFDAQGGTFAIPGMLMETGKTADAVITEKGYAAPTRFGYYFAGWSSIKSPKDDEELTKGCQDYYETTLSVATTFYAIWNPQTPTTTDGSGTWTFTNGVLECTLKDGYSSASLPVPGRGWLSFDVQTVCASDEGMGYESVVHQSSESFGGKPHVSVYARGKSLSVDYQEKKTVTVPVRDVNGSAVTWGFRTWTGDDVKFQVSNFVWTADTTATSTISFDLAGGSWAPEDAARTVVCTNQYGELPTPVRAGCTFGGWAEKLRISYVRQEDDRLNARIYYYAIGYSNLISADTYLPLETNVTLYAKWTVPAEEVLDPTGVLREAAQGNSLSVSNNPSVVSRWRENDGEYDWDGEKASWNLWQDGTNVLFTMTVCGCGTLRIPIERLYEWGSYSPEVLVDGQQYAFDLENGGIVVDVLDAAQDVHEITLSVGSYSQVEVGALSWTKADSTIAVAFDVHGGELSGEASRRFSVGAAYGELPTPTRTDYTFAGWFTAAEGGTQVVATDLVRPSAATLYAHWTCSVKTALGTDLKFVNRGGWIGTTESSVNGDGNAVLGLSDLKWGVTNVLMTAVRGRGLLSMWVRPGGDLFQWASERWGDLEYAPSFSIWVDGERIWEWWDDWDCGAEQELENNTWRKIVLPIAKGGAHVVEWRYCPGGWAGAEDTYGSVLDWKSNAKQRMFYEYQKYLHDGTTGAMIDDVKWESEKEVSDVRDWALGVAGQHVWLTGVLPAIEAAQTKKIAANPEDYEQIILRAMTKLLQLGENENLKAVLAKFGYSPDYQHLGQFFGELDYDDAPLANEVVDTVAAEAVPALESALADLELIPDSWTGSVKLSPKTYPFIDEDTFVDLADVTFAKAAVQGALAFLAIAESYDLSVDYGNADLAFIFKEWGLNPTFEELAFDHPSFAKRVRDAERLAEGKELVRDALQTTQLADARMLARTSSELHFFEYDEKHSKELQYARDEVAKGLKALDETVLYTDEDASLFSRRQYRVRGLNQSATLKPFFEGVLTRRYLPTEYDENGALVFDSFPTMEFGGILPGLTKQTVAGWLALYGINVDCTPDTDYEPEIQYRTFSAAIPKLANATSEEISDALEGSADVAVTANVTDAETYSDYETWASSLSVPLKTVKASSYAWLSYSLASPTLLTKDVTTDDLKVESFTPSSGGDGFSFVVGVDGVELGSTATAEALKGVFDVEGAETLSESLFDSANVNVQFASPEDGKLKFTASPKTSASTFFMRIKRK